MQILLIDENKERLSELRQALQDLANVKIIEVERAVYTRPPRGLSMIFMTLPAAERWKPDFKSREAQILATSEEDQMKGFPPLIITGVNLRPEDPQDSVSQVRIVLESALRAAQQYGELNPGALENIGFWTIDLTRGVTTKQLSKLLHEVLPLAVS